MLQSIRNYFKKPSQLPASVGWAEFLAFIYISFTTTMLLAYVWRFPSGNKDAALVLALVLFFLMAGCVFLATRRGVKVAYWLSVGLLMMPTGKLLCTLPTANWTISASDAVLLFLPTLSALSAAILLMLPASQAWVFQRRHELRQTFYPIPATVLLTQATPEGECQLSIKADYSNISFVERLNPNDQSLPAREDVMVIPRSCQFTLVRALNAFAKHYKLPSRDLDYDLLTAAGKAFTEQSAKLIDLHALGIEYGFNWRQFQQTINPESEQHSALPDEEAPKVGDPVYIPSELYVSHGEDDIRGGLTEIDSVEQSCRGYYWVTTKFNPSKQYNWTYLKEGQAELAEKFGQNPPQETHDYRAEYNDGWH